MSAKSINTPGYLRAQRKLKRTAHQERLQGTQLLLPIAEQVITPRERELEIALRDLLNAYNMLMPGLIYIAVPDYELVNRAPLQARKALSAL